MRVSSKSKSSTIPDSEQSNRKTSYKRIFTHSSIYIVGMLVSKAIGFIMIPIYTNYLTPADYGILELLMMTSDVIAMLIGVGLAHAVLRFYYNYESIDDQKQLVSTALIAGILIFGCIFGALLLSGNLVSRLILGSAEYSSYFDLVFITMMFFAGIEIPLVFLRAKQRSLYFVAVNLVKLILQLSLNIYLIVVLDWGILGVLYSSLISSILVSAYLSISTFRETGIHFSANKFREMLSYGYPLIFTNLGAFMLTYSDRYFLKYFTDLSEVGIYSLGYKFGMMVSILLIGPFLQFWSAEMFAAAKREDAKKVFKDFFTYSTIFSVFFCLCLSLYIREVIELIAMESYWRASTVVPLVCLAYIFTGMHGFAICGILIRKRTKLLAYSTAYAVAANVILNLMLIPSLGATGAALATIGSFWIRFYTAYRYSQGLFPLQYEWRRINTAIALAISLVIAVQFITSFSLLIRLALDTMLFIIYPVILWMFGWFHEHEKEFLVRVLKNPIQIMEYIGSLREKIAK
ncbi:MAG: oligosaccharide flippase family protein [candidate division Zixibacteria bacterium]|nr:oligosaccharide flippase family protein [candidate division Zixibacteria bacterium]